MINIELVNYEVSPDVNDFVFYDPDRKINIPTASNVYSIRGSAGKRFTFKSLEGMDEIPDINKCLCILSELKVLAIPNIDMNEVKIEMSNLPGVNILYNLKSGNLIKSLEDACNVKPEIEKIEEIIQLHIVLKADGDSNLGYVYLQDTTFENAVIDLNRYKDALIRVRCGTINRYLNTHNNDDIIKLVYDIYDGYIQINKNKLIDAINSSIFKL